MPRNITLTFEDGTQHVYKNAPDDVTPEAVQSRAQQEFSKPVKSLDGGRTPSVVDSIVSFVKKDVSAIPERVGNLVAGAARGAGSLGATLTDLARSKLGDPTIDAVPAAMRPDVTTGLRDAPRGADLRQGMDDGLQTMGADTNSTQFQAGRLATEIAGTSGTGGLLAKGLSMVPGLVAKAPAFIEAVRTGGMTTGNPAAATAGAKVLDMATRVGGGAATGRASASLIDPEHADAGTVIGALLPPATKLIGTVARGAGGATASTGARAAHDAQKMATARAGSEAGYVVPPVDLQPSFMTQLLSGLSGKIKTSQVASAKNQPVTDRLARKALGMADDAELNPDALQAVRRQAGAAYEPVRSAGMVNADEAYLNAVDRMAAVSKGASRSFPGIGDNGVEDLLKIVRRPQFDSGDAIDATIILREKADKAFRDGDTALGRAAKAAANELENMLERHLTAAGNPDAVKAFQDGRKLIAKTYSVQKALNPVTGNVSAQRLAADKVKGRPLTDELDLIASMGNAFPKATQSLKEAPGAVSPLDWLFAGGAGLGAASSGIGAAALAARPVVRSALLSRPAQAMALRQPAPNDAMDLFMEKALPLTYRAAPVLGAGRQ